jgi:hypothetical protein
VRSFHISGGKNPKCEKSPFHICEKSLSKLKNVNSHVFTFWVRTGMFSHFNHDFFWSEFSHSGEKPDPYIVKTSHILTTLLPQTSYNKEATDEARTYVLNLFLGHHSSFFERCVMWWVMHWVQQFKVQERVADAQAEFGSFPLISSDYWILFQTFGNWMKR